MVDSGLFHIRHIYSRWPDKDRLVYFWIRGLVTSKSLVNEVLLIAGRRSCETSKKELYKIVNAIHLLAILVVVVRHYNENF